MKITGQVKIKIKNMVKDIKVKIVIRNMVYSIKSMVQYKTKLLLV